MKIKPNMERVDTLINRRLLDEDWGVATTGIWYCKKQSCQTYENTLPLNIFILQSINHFIGESESFPEFHVKYMII